MKLFTYLLLAGLSFYNPLYAQDKSNTGEGTQDNDFLSQTIMNSELKNYLSGFISEQPKSSLFGLFFIKYAHDTCQYLFTTLPATKEAIFNNNPDTFLSLENKFILVNYGFNNLSRFDSLKANKIIQTMEKNRFKFKKDGGFIYSYTGIIINVTNGQYCIRKSGFTTLDIPTIKMREEVSGEKTYVPAAEELKKMPDSLEENKQQE